MRTSQNHSGIIRPVRALVKIALFTLLLAACSVEESTTSDAVHPSSEQSSRFLSQATFGPTIEETERLKTIGISAWLNDQFSKKQTLHFTYMNQRRAAGDTLSENQFLESFWQQAIKGDDQLRQRVTYALSQIFVISFQNDTLSTMPRGVAAYYDTLGVHAFGNFRNLLEAVTLHPTMGVYLSSLRNQKTSGARVPDENYAREIMQLFTIGLRTLNQDGSDAGSATYTNDDIKGLSKVFTGWSWAGPDKSSNRFFGNTVDSERDWKQMQNYGSNYHEETYDPLPAIPKSVLSVVIPQGTSGEASLKIALDTLFNHQNVGPFIGKQLIQRLVTSNPSPAYVSRVAAAFNNNGQGVRGDMKTVIAAILLDQEAMNPTITNSSGKLREPVLRFANWMRAFNANSSSGRFLIPSLDDTAGSLGQTPMRSPSVFNFYRPDYRPSNTQTTLNNLNAPEMQITEETSVVGYLNFMRSVIQNGAGTANDVKANYSTPLALAGNPDLLVDYVNLLLMQNQMSSALRTKILNAIAANPTNSANNKVYLAVYLTMASPEYLVQK
jgi:uncharacterized protein (DUF1800 family)